MSGPATRARSALPAPAEWRRFVGFLARPSLPPRADAALAQSVRAIGPLFALDLVLMMAVLGAIGIAVALGFEMPDHMLGGMKLTPALIGFIVIGAPLAEEILFRGWLSGRLGHVLGAIFFVPAVLAFAMWGAPSPSGMETDRGILMGVSAGFAALALMFVVLFRKWNAWHWFQRRFPWFYYASALLFAAIHLTNFAAAGASPALIALVVPQFVLGLILGYLRVHHGLLAGAALHMLHNGLFVSVVLAGSN